MRTELLFLLLTGCASASADLHFVEDTTHQHIADVREDVDPTVPEEAKKILAGTLDADGAVRVALLTNRELRATLREMGVARGELAQAGLLPNPVFEFEQLPERNSALELRVEWSVTGLILAPIRAHAVGPDLDTARFHAAEKVIETGNRARTAYWALVAAEQKLAIANKVLDAQAASRDVADALFRAGNIKELTVATEDAEYQSLRADTAELDLARIDAREELVRTLGLSGAATSFAIANAMPALPDLATSEHVEARAIDASLGLRAMKSELEGLARLTGLSRTEGWLPQIDADIHLLQPRDITTGATDNNWNVGAGVRTTVPLFDRKQGRTSAYEARFDALLERFYGAAIDLRSNVRTAWTKLQTAHARAKHYRDIVVPARKRVTQQAVLQYNGMQISVFQLLTIRREELQAELAAVDALAGYWKTQSTFDALMAGGGK